MRLAERVVVVTGAASGIGAACAGQLLAEGARVIEVDVQPCPRSGSAIAVTGNVVSSVHAHFGLPRRPAYAASKGALVSLARQLAVEYGDRIRVNSVLAGPIETPSWDGVGPDDRRRSAESTALGRLGRPERSPG